MMLTICFVRRGFEGMIGPRPRPDLLVSMSQRIESTNLVRCKLNLMLGAGGGCVAGGIFRPVKVRELSQSVFIGFLTSPSAHSGPGRRISRD